MSEFDHAMDMEQEALNAIEAALIKDHAIVVHTNKRIVIRFKNEHQANITIHNMKFSRRVNGIKHPLVYQIEKGLKTSHYYLQIAV